MSGSVSLNGTWELTCAEGELCMHTDYYMGTKL